MQWDDLVYVGHMLDQARKVRDKVDGIERSDFDRDENLQMTLAYLIQIIGEAARRVSSSFIILPVDDAHPQGAPEAGGQVRVEFLQRSRRRLGCVLTCFASNRISLPLWRLPEFNFVALWIHD